MDRRRKIAPDGIVYETVFKPRHPLYRVSVIKTVT
jgi:hypothetical protein